MLELNNILREIGADLTSKLKVVSPVRTGVMRSSLDYLVEGGNLSINVIEYYKYLEDRFIEREIDKYDLDDEVDIIAETLLDDIIKNNFTQ